MNSFPKKEEITADPFAADIFAAPPSEDLPAEKFTKAFAEDKNLWSLNLPKVLPAAANWNNLWRNLPSDFSAKLPQRLAVLLTQLLNLPEGQAIGISQLSQSEINRAENFISENNWWLTVRLEESAAEIAFEIDDIFAAGLVDAMIGDLLPDSGQIRELTLNELTVIEFLALNLNGEANRVLHAPIFKFNSLSRNFPAFLQQNLQSENPSILVINWQIKNESLPAIVKMYLTPEVLKALQPNENRLLGNRPNRRKNWQNAQTKIKNVRMRFLFGNVELSVAELFALEKDDIVLLNSYKPDIYNGNLSGQAEILLGDDENVKIIGEFTDKNLANEVFETAAENDFNEIPVRRLNLHSARQILIKSFEETEISKTHNESMMETDDEFTNENTEETDEQAGLAVENLALTLRVELEARRLSLAEVENLRENQILELGIRPTETVNLLIDNQNVGRGELVMVEERLGVRITKLLR